MTEDAARIMPADEGTIGTTADGRAFIRFERHLAHPVDRVWAAMVEPASMMEWLAHRVEIEPRVGGRLAIWLGSPNDQSIHDSVITVFDPPHFFKAVSEDQGTLSWELRPQGGGTKLIFVHLLEAGERASNSVIAGWHIRMEHIVNALAGRAVDWHALEATRDEHGSIARITEIYWHYRNQPR